MNDAIFKFKRYEDSSLSYTGIDKHANQAVGGWDTVIRREEYERLFANQQETMTSGLRTSNGTPIVAVSEEEKNAVKKLSEEEKTVIKLRNPLPLTQVVPELKNRPKIEEQTKDPEYIPPNVEVGTVVIHKTFGEGVVSWIQQSKKYIYVKFTGKGDKTFVYPDAFKMGFLTLK